MNDLIRDFNEIIKLFEGSTIPLDEVFGSNTEQYAPHSVILSFGSAVESAILREILELLGEYGPDFLLLDEEGFPHKKQITIGSYNLDNEEVVPMSDGFRKRIVDDQLDIGGLHLIYKQATKISIIENKKKR